MAVEDRELAESISRRLDELMSITGLSLEGLAVISKVKSSYLKAVWYGNVPISAEWLKKIGSPFNINLVDFFKFNESLPLDLKEKHVVKSFYKKYKGKDLGYFQTGEKVRKVPAGQARKYERDKIAHIVLQTEYFDKAHPVKEMLADFVKEYDLVLESGRLYELLGKYVGKELEKKETTKYNLDGSTARLKVYAYVRKRS